MTFEEILDQAIAMLQRRGRLTYGALKRQFQLDDAYLDDLKAELIEGQRVAVDEDSRVLVWTGGAAVPPLTALSAPQPARPPRASQPGGPTDAAQWLLPVVTGPPGPRPPGRRRAGGQSHRGTEWPRCRSARSGVAPVGP